MAGVSYAEDPESSIEWWKVKACHVAVPFGSIEERVGLLQVFDLCLFYRLLQLDRLGVDVFSSLA